MDKPKFEYTIYIGTTLEKLWSALTTGSITSQYWYGRQIESDWAIGSPVVFRDSRTQELTDSGRVIACEAPRRLSYSWHVIYDPKMRKEHPSRVTFELEPLKEAVKLRVTHEDFETGSKVFEGISQGWPEILSSLKSLLETGRPLALG
jgi:uncharacterized protein YndB with AHSA1/START domain